MNPIEVEQLRSQKGCWGPMRMGKVTKGQLRSQEVSWGDKSLNLSTKVIWVQLRSDSWGHRRAAEVPWAVLPMRMAKVTGGHWGQMRMGRVIKRLAKGQKSSTEVIWDQLRSQEDGQFRLRSQKVTEGRLRSEPVQWCWSVWIILRIRIQDLDILQ